MTAWPTQEREQSPPIRRYAQLAASPPPPPLVGVFGWRAGLIGAVTGAPGCGKSAVTLAAALEVTRWQRNSDWMWCHNTVTCGDVLWIAAEGIATIAPRIDAWAEQHNALPPHGFGVLDPRLVWTCGPAAQSGDAAVERLAEACRDIELQPRLIVLDTLAASLEGTDVDENSAQGVGRVIRWARLCVSELTFGQTHGPAIIVIHHTGKDEGRGPRGHSSLLGALDTEARVVKMGPRALRVVVEKNRWGVSGRATDFVLRAGGGGDPTHNGHIPLGVCAIHKEES